MCSPVFSKNCKVFVHHLRRKLQFSGNDLHYFFHGCRVCDFIGSRNTSFRRRLRLQHVKFSLQSLYFSSQPYDLFIFLFAFFSGSEFQEDCDKWMTWHRCSPECTRLPLLLKFFVLLAERSYASFIYVPGAELLTSAGLTVLTSCCHFLTGGSLLSLPAAGCLTKGPRMGPEQLNERK